MALARDKRQEARGKRQEAIKNADLTPHFSRAPTLPTVAICSIPYSLFPVPCSLFPVPCSLFPVPSQLCYKYFQNML
ncbi:hypothetical protein BJP36_37650 [Moorena producens JHB]|uniref:Uncharacterized protein n=1 Tax=Moorena producens (strain JHB) TaxID=1454205 RepID=A0A9Q9SUC4_MOOP1|nr:hypothetical protein [Moorena producens]WAN69821.1 hypothetical protein BJP36_37650 [Moorena producens JHB]